MGHCHWFVCCCCCPCCCCLLLAAVRYLHGRGGSTDDRIRQMKACAVVANDAEAVGYMPGEVQEATETLFTSGEVNVPKLKRMYGAALAKAAAIRHQSQLLGPPPGAMAGAAYGGAMPPFGGFVGPVPGFQMYPPGGASMPAMGVPEMPAYAGQGHGGMAARRQAAPTDVCRACHQRGHYARECPMRRQQVAAAAAAAGPVMGANAVPLGGVPRLMPPPGQ